MMGMIGLGLKFLFVMASFGIVLLSIIPSHYQWTNGSLTSSMNQTDTITNQSLASDRNGTKTQVPNSTVGITKLPQNTTNQNSNNNRASIRAGTFRNATDYIRDMFIFNDVCMRYIQLEVIEEVEKCLTIYQEYNGYMGQLWQNHNETITKNLVIGNETGVWYERIPPLE
jgi:hypothetical protein